MVYSVTPMQQIEREDGTPFSGDVNPRFPARAYVIAFFGEHQTCPSNVGHDFLHAKENGRIDERDAALTATGVHQHYSVNCECLQGGQKVSFVQGSVGREQRSHTVKNSIAHSFSIVYSL